MGLCNSPDIFQEKMNELFADLDYVRTYIDDLLILSSKSFEDHLQKLDKVLKKLLKAGFKINAEKSFFAQDQLEYLPRKTSLHRSHVSYMVTNKNLVRTWYIN